MKETYEKAMIEIVFVNHCNVITASNDETPPLSVDLPEE